MWTKRNGNANLETIMGIKIANEAPRCPAIRTARPLEITTRGRVDPETEIVAVNEVGGASERGVTTLVSRPQVVEAMVAGAMATPVTRYEERP